MLSVKGTFRDGVALPAQAVEGHDGREVIITFLEIPADPPADSPEGETNYDALSRLIEECRVDTGLTDLAHQHDHYLHGTPKRP